MCKKHELVRVKIPSDLSCTGKEKWKYAQIDQCISGIVSALQKYGIDMRGCCCGHGNCDGEIELADGRMIIIKPSALEYYQNQPIELMLWDGAGI